jgi:hypothetical protein
MIELLSKDESLKIKCITDPVNGSVIVILLETDNSEPISKSIIELTNTEKKTLMSNPALDKLKTPEKIHIHNASDEEIEFVIYHSTNGEDIEIYQNKLQSKASITYLKDTGWPQIVTSNTNTTPTEPWTITELTTSGVWEKPANLKWLLAICIGAGGGGGSGRRGPNGATRFGGGAGGGGAITEKLIEANSLASSISYTIGSKGIGGASVETNNTNGNNGTNGGDTIFGSILAKGGNAGLGGTAAAGTAGTGGQSSSCIPAYSPYSLTGANGGGGTSTNGTNGSLGLAGNTACPAGGGGGGVSAVNAYGTLGGNGGGVYSQGILISGPTSASANGTNNASRFIIPSTEITSNLGIGTAGAGGFGNGAFINGGNAGNYGAGGGGGGASIDGLNSGRGGNGSDGLIILFEIFN